MSATVKAFILRAEKSMATLPPEEAQANASTPQERLLRAARNGQFEALVCKARPAQPVAMVTPEEREAELRRTGRWPPDKPKAKRKPKEEPAKKPEPKKPERELPPNEQYIAEHCHWRQRGPSDYAWARPEYNRCLTEYNPLTGEIIGDGYDHSGEDDEW